MRKVKSKDDKQSSLFHDTDLGWCGSNFWDQPLGISQLRVVQQLAGVDPIERLRRTITDYGVVAFRELLRGLITLLPGATGIGKTLLMLSVLFKINEVFGRGKPRVRNVLWFTIDQTLRAQVAAEFQTEPVRYGLIERHPPDESVRIADGFKDIDAGPGVAALTVACIHSVFEIEGKDTHTPEAITAALSKYDTIIYDECDWADGRVQRAAELAGDALQFSMTASPLTAGYTDEEIRDILKAKHRGFDAISEGEQYQRLTAAVREIKKFCRRFVVIAKDAVADYARAVDLDSCLKIFDEVREGGEHVEYTARRAGKDLLQVRKAGQDEWQLFASCAADAIKDADDREKSMRADDPHHYYSPHIIVRVTSIEAVQWVGGALAKKISEWIDLKHIQSNVGWGVCVVYSGSKRDVGPEEKDLLARTPGGKFRHPFMRARDYDGRADDRCKRVLVICDIGIRGLNHTYVDTVVDCTPTKSPYELIHFDYGRPIRWPTGGTADRRKWHDQSHKMHEYVKSYVYIPDGGEEFVGMKRAALLHARDFVENMRERINGTFFTWDDLMIAGEKPATFASTFDPSAPPLTAADEYRIQAALEKAFEANDEGFDEDDVERAVNFIEDERTRLKGRVYADKLIDNSNFRGDEIAAEKIVRGIDEGEQALAVLLCLLPQKTFTEKQLVRFVKRDAERKDDWPEFVRLIEVEKNQPVITLISDKLRAKQSHSYSPTGKFLVLNKDVFPRVWGEWTKDLRKAGEFPAPTPVFNPDGTPKLNKKGEQIIESGDGITNKLLRSAAMSLLGLDDATDTGEMGNNPAYHAAILGKYRNDIKCLAKHYLNVRNGRFKRVGDWRRR